MIQHTFIDYPHPEKDAVVYYMSGCQHSCLNCHSPELQEFERYGRPIMDTIDLISKALQKYKTNNLVISGGDCLHHYNLQLTKCLCNWFKKIQYVDICLYSGYDLEYIQKCGIVNFDFIKGGKYIEELKQKSEKTDDYIQFASKNQFLIDTNKLVISKNGRYDFPKN